MKLADQIRQADFVYICGNGGSASTANHFANDLVKMCGVKAISLCANEAVITAYANDDGYERVFYHQLKVFLTENDLLITISGSGTSDNILMAQGYAEGLGAELIAFPTMEEMDLNMQEVETYHLQLVHEIATELSL